MLSHSEDRETDTCTCTTMYTVASTLLIKRVHVDILLLVSVTFSANAKPIYRASHLGVGDLCLPDDIPTMSNDLQITQAK